jgi:hypothetical protein
MASRRGWFAAVVGPVSPSLAHQARFGATVLAQLAEWLDSCLAVCTPSTASTGYGGGPGMPCGLWIGTADADYIYYEVATTPFHQAHIAMHEIAHMLLGHRGRAPATQDLSRLLAPDVDLGLIRLILGRNAYGTAEEEDAETLAYLIFQHPSNPVHPAPTARSEEALT